MVGRFHRHVSRGKASEANGWPSLPRTVAFDRLTRSTDNLEDPIKLWRCKFESPALTPRFDDFLDGLFERLRNVPLGIMGSHFAQVGVITNVVAVAVLIHVGIGLRLACKSLRHFERLQDGTGVCLAAAEVIDLPYARCGHEFRHEPRHVQRVYVVPHLFAFVTVNLVFPVFEVALHEVGQKTVQLHAGVVRASQATATQAARRHPEVAPVFLHHHVSRNLGGAEERVFRLVDGECLRDAVLVL